MGRLLILAAAALLTLPAQGAAQGGEGFLFKQPIISLGLRAGYAMPRASSDIYDYTIDQLTLEKGDFGAGYFGGELAARVSDRVDIAFSVGHSSSSTSSEFRDWVDLDDNAIEQVTDLAITPITVGVKYYLSERGRSIGRFAWIPTRVNPYVGGGVGFTLFQFEQRGDFVDFETLDIFNTVFRSDGNARSLHATAGVDLSISKNLFLTGEGRYSWAKGSLDEFVFEGFDKMDLAGLQFTVGLSARF